MFCKYCGNQLAEQAIFCSKCGNKIVTESAHNASDMQKEADTFSNYENVARKTPFEKWLELAKKSRAIAVLTALLAFEFALCCFQIYKVTDSFKTVEYFQEQAATSQYMSDYYDGQQTLAQEQIYGKSMTRSAANARANEMWNYLDFAEHERTKNIVLLVLYLAVFSITIFAFVKTSKKQN